MKPHEIGKIPLELYRMFVPTIDTDIVVITKQQVEHINMRHHGDYDVYNEYIPEILKNPDRILQDKKRPQDTVVLLKSFQMPNKIYFYLVLHLHRPQDDPAHSNSVISFWYLHQREYDRLMKFK